MRNELNGLRRDVERLRGRNPELQSLEELPDEILWTILRAGRPALPADPAGVTDEMLAAIAGEAGG